MLMIEETSSLVLGRRRGRSSRRMQAATGYRVRPVPGMHHLDHDTIERGDRNQINHESLLEGIVPFHRGFHCEGLKARK
jgi:hypothetical protein